jgi:glycosyltransferase involved in cell wall biosynthesis
MAAPSPSIVYPAVSELVLSQPVDPVFSNDLRRRLAVDGTTPVILITTARISERKNQLGVLQAIAKVHQNGPVRFHYLIVGNVDSGEHESYRRHLEFFIQEHGLEEFTSFIANSSDEEKVAYLDACDVLVMLSRTVGASVEGFGISAIEASCRGKPVIVSDQGGMPETIIEGCTGFAVSPEDTGQLAKTLVTLATSEVMRADMGKAGRIFAQSRFTPEVSARGFHEHLTLCGFFNR